jgi:hypothetical protein
VRARERKKGRKDPIPVDAKGKDGGCFGALDKTKTSYKSGLIPPKLVIHFVVDNR